MITATWVPGFEVAEAPAGDAGDYTGGPPKLVWHTSETDPGSLDGIVSELHNKQHTDVYHICADTKLRRVVQVLPLNKAASALMHPDGVETNHDGAVQVCVIGRAHDMPALSADDIAWLGTAVLAPISRAVPDISLGQLVTFYSDAAGFTLASADARQRMAPAVWDAFNGQCGHQHVPGNDHWDPGGLNVAAITASARTALAPPAPSPVQQSLEAIAVLVAQISIHALERGDKGAGVELMQTLLNKHAADPQLKVDGIYGATTDAAVARFKTAHGLGNRAGNLCGRDCIHALMEAPAK